MATKYARAGGGDWSADATWSTTSGGAADTTAPTAADDVILDGASGNVTIDSGATRYCRSLDCGTASPYTGTLIHAASTALNIGDGTAGTGNRALRFSAGMTYTLGNSASAVVFASTSATVQTVTSASKSFAYVYFNGTGGSWQLVDAFTCTSTFELVRGTLDTNGQTVTSAAFGSSYSNTRTLTLGSSAITLSGAGSAWNVGTATNFTLNAGTSTITLSGAGVNVLIGSNTASNTYNDLVLSGSGSVLMSIPSAGWSCRNLTRTGTAAKTDALTFSGNPTVTGTFTATGNSASANRLLVASYTLGTARTITAAAVSLTNVDFRDITGAGAATWSGTSVGNALGNTGITFTTPVTCTHKAGAAGNWSTAANWDTGTVPLCHDTVVIPATTTGTLTVDMPRAGADVSFSASGVVPAFGTTAIEIYGSLALGSSNPTGANVTTFRGRSSHTITSNGRTWAGSLYFDTATGSYALADALASSRSNTGAIFVVSGTFADGGFSVTGSGANFGYSQSGGTLTASGTWTFGTTGAVTLWGVSGGTVNHTGTIALTGNTASDRTFAGGGKTYGTVTDTNTSTGKLEFAGANTFGTLTITGTNARTVVFPASTTTTFTGAVNLNGASGQLLTINSSSSGTAATLSKASGVVSCSYLSLQDSAATGGAAWYAGTTSTNVSGNTGWSFTTAPSSIVALGGSRGFVVL